MAYPKTTAETYYGQSNLVVGKLDEWRTSTVHPDYAELILARQRIPETAHYRKRIRRDTPVAWYDPWGGANYNTPTTAYHTWGASPAVINGTEKQTLRDAARVASVNKALKRLSMGDLQLGIALATLKDTNLMVASTAVRLVSCIRNIKKGRLKDAAKALGKVPPRTLKLIQKDYRLKKITKKDLVANSWLELHFGWMPLISDIHGAAEITADLIHRPEDRLIKVRGKREESRTGIAEESGSVSSVAAEKFTVTHRHLLFAQIGDLETYTVSSLGLNNPALIAWDLLPYSFVWDWIQPISSYLNAIGRTEGLTFIDGSTSRRETREYVARHYSGPHSYSAKIEGSCSYTLTLDEYERTVLSTWPSPEVPDIDLLRLVDGWKAITSLALLQSAFGGKKLA